MMARAVAILIALRQVRLIEHRRADWMIVAERAVPKQDIVDDFPAVHGVLECEAHGHGVEKGHPAKVSRVPSLTRHRTARQ